MHRLFTELFPALRALRRVPALTVSAVVSIGLGIGASTMVLSWLESIVVRPYPVVPDAERLVALNIASATGESWPVSYPVLREWRRGVRSLEGLAAWSASRVSVRDRGENGSSPALAMLISGDYFAVLRVRMSSGRSIQPDDERTAAAVAVVSDDYWERRFGRSTDIIGRSVWANGQPVEIVGVAPRGFIGTYVGVPADLWMPLTLQPRLLGTNTLDDRAGRWLQTLGRLSPGADLPSARREIDAFARRSSAEHGDRPVTGALTRLPREQFLGQLMTPLLVTMLAVTGIVLLVASANVAALLLVRASARRRELAVRAALGGSRWRVAAPLVVESVVIAVLGGALGVLVAYAARGSLQAFVPPARFRVVLPIVFDARVLAGTLLLIAGAALICGIAPALRAVAVPPAAVLSTARGVAGDGHRLRSMLVTAQVAFSFLCLVCAGLFVRSLRTSVTLDLGFEEPRQVLLVGTDFAPTQLGDSGGVVAMQAVLGRLRSLPGVERAAAATMVPLGFGGHRYVAVRIPGREVRPDENNSTEQVLASNDYFEMMGTRLVTGRTIADRDRAGAVPVVVVNEAFVHRFGLAPSPIGARIDVGRGPVTIIGVVRDGKYDELTEAPSPVAFFPLAQWFQPSMTFHLRTRGDPMQLAMAVRAVLTATHVDLPSSEPRTLAEHIGASTFVQRVGASLLTAFGALALVMAAVGLYGVLALSVASRRREIGIRIALGASRGAITGSVVRHAALVTAGGVIIGGALAVMVGRLLRGQLADVSAADPAAFGAATALLGAVGSIAGWLPAQRAAQIEPAITLRSD